MLQSTKHNIAFNSKIWKVRFHIVKISSKINETKKFLNQLRLVLEIVSEKRKGVLHIFVSPKLISMTTWQLHYMWLFMNEYK